MHAKIRVSLTKLYQFLISIFFNQFKFLFIRIPCARSPRRNLHKKNVPILLNNTELKNNKTKSYFFPGPCRLSSVALQCLACNNHHQWIYNFLLHNAVSILRITPFYILLRDRSHDTNGTIAKKIAALPFFTEFRRPLTLLSAKYSDIRQQS